MIQKNILFEHSAVDETLRELYRVGYRWSNIQYINKGRYCIVKGNPNIAILLKTEPFFNFGQMFKGEKGVGDSINCNALKTFVCNGVGMIYTKFRDGKLYKISIADVLQKSHKWTQKEGTEVRSFSIHCYERVNKPTPSPNQEECIPINSEPESGSSG